MQTHLLGQRCCVNEQGTEANHMQLRNDICITRVEVRQQPDLKLQRHWPAVGGKMHSAALWLGLSGLVIIAVLMQRKMRARMPWPAMWRALSTRCYCCSLRLVVIASGTACRSSLVPRLRAANQLLGPEHGSLPVKCVLGGGRCDPTPTLTVAQFNPKSNSKSDPSLASPCRCTSRRAPS